MKARFAFPLTPLAALAATLVPAVAQTTAPLHPTLHHTVMVGYQGWYRAAGNLYVNGVPVVNDGRQVLGDGSGQGWFHYAANSGTPTSPTNLRGNLNVDYLPDVSEMSHIYQTDLTRRDGTPVYVSSSYDASTVLTHFQWMQTYGIDGAFVQRFPSAFIVQATTGAKPYPYSINTSLQTEFDQVLVAEAAAAEATGRSFAIMYDLTGFPANWIQLVTSDWTHLQTLQVNGHAVLGSPAYQQHNGQPVVGVFGIGLTPQGNYPPLPDVRTLLQALGPSHCIVAGVPSGWLRQTTTNTFPDEDDAIPPSGTGPTLLQVLQLANIIMPWSPGRYQDLGKARLHAEQYWVPDLAWCKTNNVEYLPVVFPGFSNYNQSIGVGVTPGQTAEREAGRFLWEQYRLVADAGCTMVYQAMFDEMDEGTQIFKVSNNPPPGQHLLGYEHKLPNDYYLTLVGAATALFHQTPIQEPFPSRIPPLTFNDQAVTDAVNSFLQDTNRDVYQNNANRYWTDRAIAYYLPLLVTWSNYAPTDALINTPVTTGIIPQGASITLNGTATNPTSWPTRPFSSTDPNASITWSLPVPVPGNYALLIRSPGPSQNNYATNAQLTVTQSGNGVSTQPRPLTVNLGSNTQAWYNIGVLNNLAANTPCIVTLSSSPSAPKATSTLPTLINPITFFEARLVPVSRP